MIAFAQNFKERPSRGGFSPSMKGSEHDDVLDFAEHLQANAPLGMDGKEAFRMANAQAPERKIDTLRIAIQVAMRELAMEAMRRLEARQAEEDSMAA